MSADRLVITGLRATGHHGVYEHERRDGQDFVIDVTVWADLSAASRSDDLGETLHYGVLAERVVAAVERDPVDLIETLAARIVDVVFEFPTAQTVEVTVHKPQAPISVPFQDVAVTLTRSR